MLTDQEKIDIIDSYKSGTSASDLSKRYNKSLSSICQFLSYRKIPKNPRIYKHKYFFDNTIFDIIDTEEKAYWLGFIFGDGSVTKYRLNLQLADKDLNHIKKFKKFLKSDNPISSRKNNISSYDVFGVDFVKNLNKYGIVPRKTYKETLTPKQIPDDLLCHFYRGVIDADGWIAKHSKNNYVIGTCSYCYNFLLEMQNWISGKIGHKSGYLVDRKRNNQRCAYLSFSGNNHYIKVYELLYKNATIYLDRKKILADEFVKNINLLKKS